DMVAVACMFASFYRRDRLLRPSVANSGFFGCAMMGSRGEAQMKLYGTPSPSRTLHLGFITVGDSRRFVRRVPEADYASTNPQPGTRGHSAMAALAATNQAQRSGVAEREPSDRRR